jgi:hypothetical protein
MSMVRVTIQRADGSSSLMLIQSSDVTTMDQDNRQERDRKGANTVVTMKDGRKLWVKETVEQIADKLGV